MEIRETRKRPYIPFPLPEKPVDDKDKENNIKKESKTTHQNTEQQKNQSLQDKVSLNKLE